VAVFRTAGEGCSGQRPLRRWVAAVPLPLSRKRGGGRGCRTTPCRSSSRLAGKRMLGPPQQRSSSSGDHRRRRRRRRTRSGTTAGPAPPARGGLKLGSGSRVRNSVRFRVKARLAARCGCFWAQLPEHFASYPPPHMTVRHVPSRQAARPCLACKRSMLVAQNWWTVCYYE